ELDRPFVLGQRGGVGAEARDGVVAGFAPADGIRELAAAPVIHLQIPWCAEQAVKAAKLFGDGGVFQRGIEDVDRLVLARHAMAILPLVVTAPRWLPEQEEGNVVCGGVDSCGDQHSRRAPNYRGDK